MSRVSSRGARALSLLVALGAVGVSADEPRGAGSPCAGQGPVVTVDVRRRELWLCEQGTPVATFHVAIGRNGTDKRRTGDGRTPLGSYALGAPRPSAEYGLFIPIGYPTPEQAAQGFTGSKLGIHGPPRGLTEPVYPTTAVDWTQGCIATGVDADIERIAQFVRAHQPEIVIR